MKAPYFWESKTDDRLKVIEENLKEIISRLTILEDKISYLMMLA